MHSFYKKAAWKQWVVTILLFLIGIAIVIIWSSLMVKNPILYFSIFLVVPFFQFFFSPFFTKIGMYTYLSPMLLAFGATETSYGIHNGTSFDYLFAMQGVKPGLPWKKKLLSYYLEGLLEIVAKIEKGEIPPSINVWGSSYFFSESTANRLGFSLSETGYGEKLNILFNYLDLLWMYSLANGKLTFPKLKGIKTASIKGEMLVTKKADLERLYERVK
ncbi:MAG: hypothetical protein KDC24_10680 [Saprospiraceae bacterium]|nr:hypothetical protein [Saprospiraceae bacterium]